MPGTPTAAILITEDGTVRLVVLDLADSLRSTYEYLDCELGTVVELSPRLDMWLDKDALPARPLNPAATRLAAVHGHVHQPYHGPALLTGVRPSGTTVGLTDEQERSLLAFLSAHATA